MVRIQQFTMLNGTSIKLDEYKDIVIVEMDNIKLIEVTDFEEHKKYYPTGSVEHFEVNNIF